MDSKIKLHFNNFFEIARNAEFTVNSSKVAIDEWFQRVVNCLNEVKTRQSNLFFLGNGASASISDHFATDFSKNGVIPSFSCTESALITCFSNDYSYEDAYMEILKRKMREGDGLVIVSSSGASKNLVNAAKYVIENYSNNPIITFTAFSPDNPVRNLGIYNLFLMATEYSFAESGHAYYLHLLIDLFCNQKDVSEERLGQICQTNIG